MAEPMVATNNTHTLLLKKDGTVWGCGNNNAGQLGFVNTSKARASLMKLNVPAASFVACGASFSNSFFVQPDGKVLGCGYNNNYQLGLGYTGVVSTPVHIEVEDVRQIGCGFNHTIFLKTDGTVWGCGSGGYLGIGDTNIRKFPTKLGIDSVKQIACASWGSLFLKTDGTVWGCGGNNYGQINPADRNNGQVFPVKLNIAGVKQIAYYNEHIVVLKNDGSVWACGWNAFGQLGVGDTNSRDSFVRLNISNVKEISAGFRHTICIKNDGTVWGCGDNFMGQLGLGDIPKQLTIAPLNISNVTHASCALYHTIFMKSDESLWGCGDNSNAQLGSGDVKSKLTPSQMITQKLYMLLQDAEGYKTIQQNSIQGLNINQLTGDVITNQGFTAVDDLKQVWPHLDKSFGLVCYQANAINSEVTVAQIPPQQLIIPTADLDLSAYSIIKQITLTTTGTNGVVKVIFSFDGGATWRTYTGGAWAAIEPTTHAVATSGVTAADVAAIPTEAWTAVTGPLRVAYCLAKSAITDDLAVAQLTITGNTSSWDKARHMTDYDYEYPSTATLLVKLLADGSYKINRMNGGER